VSEVLVPQNGRVRGHVVAVGEHHVAIATGTRSFTLVERSAVDGDVALRERAGVEG